MSQKEKKQQILIDTFKNKQKIQVLYINLSKQFEKKINKHMFLLNN